jgi:hypothetical protein
MNSVGYEFVTNLAPEPLGSGTLGCDAVLRVERVGRLWLGQAGQLGRAGVGGGKRMAVGPGSASGRVLAHSQFCYLKFLFLFQICL